jgi:hypothetical protein
LSISTQEGRRREIFRHRSYAGGGRSCAATSRLRWHRGTRPRSPSQGLQARGGPQPWDRVCATPGERNRRRRGVDAAAGSAPDRLAMCSRAGDPRRSNAAVPVHVTSSRGSNQRRVRRMSAGDHARREPCGSACSRGANRYCFKLRLGVGSSEDADVVQVLADDSALAVTVSDPVPYPHPDEDVLPHRTPPPDATMVVPGDGRRTPPHKRYNRFRSHQLLSHKVRRGHSSRSNVEWTCALGQGDRPSMASLWQSVARGHPGELCLGRGRSG